MMQKQAMHNPAQQQQMPTAPPVARAVMRGSLGSQQSSELGAQQTSVPGFQHSVSWRKYPHEPACWSCRGQVEFAHRHAVYGGS